jgi:hypothetical protein
MVINHQDYKNGTLLLAELYQTNYSGLSGLTAFDSNGDRLAYAISIAFLLPFSPPQFFFFFGVFKKINNLLIN